MNNSRSRWLFTGIAACLATWALAQPGLGTAPDDAARAKCHLYVLIGQSNMAGRGKVEKEDTTPHPRVLALNKEDQWVPAVDPLHFDKPSAGVGPGLTFGKALADANQDVTIGLIPCAAGGSPITVWKKNAFWGQTKSKPYDEALRRVAVARKRGVLKGILWHQGESDSNEKEAKLYANRLADLVTRLRRDLEAPEVPFLVGGLSKPLRTRSEHARVVDQALRDYAKGNARSAYIESDKLTLMTDHTHFDAASAREFGKRYAKALLSRTVKVLILSGVPETHHDYKKQCPNLAEVLKKEGHDVVLRDQAIVEEGDAGKFDVLVLMSEKWRGDKKNRQELLKMVRDGKGLVVIHMAYVPCVEALGGKAGRNGKTGNLKVEIADKKHPVTQGVDDFTAGPKDELYAGVKFTADDVQVLAKGQDTLGTWEPVAWVRPFGKGRVFYCSLGHSTDSQKNPGFLKLVTNAVRWTAAKPEGK